MEATGAVPAPAEGPAPVPHGSVPALPLPAGSRSAAGLAVAVSGGSSGIGRAVAARFLDRGAAVAVLARRGERLEALLDEHRPSRERTVAVAGDATVRAQVEAFVAEAEKRLGRLDVFVVNAGLNVRERALDRLDPADWRRMLAVNLDAAYHCTQAALPLFRAQGAGLFVYVTSRSARRADGSGAAYQAAKHGVVGLAGAVRFEEERRGIRATVLYPGVVNTPLVLQRPVPPSPEDLAEALQPDDVAAAVEFVATLPGRVVVSEMEMYPLRPM